jgi:ATP-binding cassette subfamily F protein 3
VLVLDEPTNHLDLESREALEAALRTFGGSVLLVSHDRALLDAVGTRTIAVQDGTLRSYAGGWADHARVREERAAEQAPPPRPRKGKPRRAPDHAQQTARLEREIEAAEAALAALEDELADPAAWADQSKAVAASRRHTEAQRAVEDLYAKLEALAE